jgi:hypothetical protein
MCCGSKAEWSGAVAGADTEQEADGTRRRRKGAGGSGTGFVATAAIGKPRARARAPSEAAINRQAHLDRAIAECAPLAAPGTPEAARMARAVRKHTARPRGLRLATAEAMVTKPRRISQVVGGPNPIGGAAEIAVLEAIDRLRASGTGGMVNPPPSPQPNEVGLRQWPDACGKKDLGSVYRLADGSLGLSGTTQVKAGTSEYVARDLANELGARGKPGNGVIAAVDARLVEPDGSPRVGPGAFTKGQGKRIRAAGVELRGVPDLEDNARALVADVRRFEADGRGPVELERVAAVEADLRAAYGGSAIAMRAGADAALAGAAHVALAAAVAVARGEAPDVDELVEETCMAAARGTLPAIANAGIYHGATLASAAPELAALIARRAVGPLFVAVAAFGDIAHERAACRRGDVSPTAAVARVGAKTALNATPLFLTPLGPWAVAIGFGVQLIGRWWLR